MQKVTITALNASDKTSKGGKSYKSVGIQIAELPNTWINGFGDATTDGWNIGDVVNIDVVDKEYNGKIYKNFSVPKAKPVTREEFDALKAQVDQLLGNRRVPNIPPQPEYQPPLTNEDVPFM